MTQHDERVLSKLDKIDEQLAAMNATLKVQAEQLRYHIARTDALETLAQDYRDEMLDKVTPIEQHVLMLKGAAKVFVVAGSITALILSALKIFWN
jgi:uncharacterized membrane-anchored protein YhcB (DUF1043 family)